MVFMKMIVIHGNLYGESGDATVNSGCQKWTSTSSTTSDTFTYADGK